MTPTASRRWAPNWGTAAVRTATTTVTGTTTKTTSAITYEVANAQGTAVQSWTTGGAVARRYYDPYGQQIGTPPGWPDNHDFLGKPQDPDTGYDLLGARQYNPATGAFLSLDPVFRPGDALAMGGYAYADDDPANRDDPTGTTVNTYQACASDSPYCGGSVWDNVQFAPHGGFVDFLGGLLNSGYSALQSALVGGALAAGGPSEARAVASVLPARIPIGNPRTPLYGAGGLSPLLIPGLDEADGAGLIIDRLAIASAPERLAPPTTL